MFWAWIFVLKLVGFVFDLFGQSVTAHFGIPRFILAHSQYLSSLSSWFVWTGGYLKLLLGRRHMLLNLWLV